MISLIVFFIIFVVLISAVWVIGIDKMKEEHPDYKGEDFLNNNNEKKY
jgi:hypothetical protein